MGGARDGPRITGWAGGAVPGRNFTPMVPRRYGRPSRLAMSVGYGRGGRGAPASLKPLSMPGDVRSEMNVRSPGAASCAATVLIASVITARTPAGLKRDIKSLGRRWQGNPMLLQV